MKSLTVTLRPDTVTHTLNSNFYYIFSRYWANFIDLSPVYSSHLLGISNSIASLPGVVGNDVTGAMLKGHGNDWGLVFSVAGGIASAGALCFLLFSKSVDQHFERTLRPLPPGEDEEGEGGGKRKEGRTHADEGGRTHADEGGVDRWRGGGGDGEEGEEEGEEGAEGDSWIGPCPRPHGRH